MDQYQELETIGSGSFGTVTKVKHKDGRIMVWKKINYGRMSPAQKQQLTTEVNVLKLLNHEHILRYYEYINSKSSTTLYIVTEYCSGGDLSSYLKQTKNKIDEDVIWKIFHQLMEALHYCHTREKKILHRDIKPANIFIDQNGNNIKLGDFGLSRELGEYSEFANTHVGTPYYMSPELIENKSYNEKSDIWSAGCLIYEMAALKRPFSDSNIFQLGKKIKSGKFDRIPLIYSQNLQLAISRMLSVDPEQRPTASQLLSLPMMKIRRDQKEVQEKYEKLRKKQILLKQRQDECRRKLQKLKQLKKTPPFSHKSSDFQWEI